MVIVVGSQKGGVGKTTIATNLAIWLVKEGADVLLIDADDQGSTADFTTWREANREHIGYTLAQLTGPNVRKQVEAFRPKYDHIVIDTGGRDTTSQRAAMFICDVYLSPFAPRSYDLWTVTKVAALIDEIQAGRQEPFDAYSFLSRADIKSADNREVSQALLDYPQLTFLPYPISNRKAFANSASKGLAVFEMDEPDKKAVAEIDALFKHILHGNVITTTAQKAAV